MRRHLVLDQIDTKTGTIGKVQYAITYVERVSDDLIASGNVVEQEFATEEVGDAGADVGAGECAERTVRVVRRD